jgi:two-component system phosphate regulon sensor histidine kinase PhoR
LLIKLGTFWRFGWRPIASYFFLFLVFFALTQLTSDERVSLWGAAATAFICSAILALIMYKRLINPLGEMAEIAQEMARGNLDQEIRNFAQDEIGDLARSINYMARQLKSNIESVISEKNRIQAILSSIADGVIAVDNWGRVILINPVVEELFGIDMAYSKGKNILRVIRNYELEKMLSKALETGCPVEKQIEILTPEPLVFRVHVTPLKNIGVEHGGAVAVLKDVTERKRVEEMRSDFVANVSHELRTPLTSIRGFAETLLDGAIDEPKLARQFLEIMNTETERLSRLIDELLNLSKIEDRKTVPSLQLLKIEDLIQRTVMISNIPGKDEFYFRRTLLYPDLDHGRTKYMSRIHKTYPDIGGNPDYLIIPGRLKKRKALVGLINVVNRFNHRPSSPAVLAVFTFNLHFLNVAAVGKEYLA